MIQFIFRVSIFLCIICLANDVQGQVTIADARAMGEGAEVTVRGIVTNGSELGIIRYIQDSTAGIAIYPGSGSVGNFSSDVKRGDLIEVTGSLKEFNGLLEVDPIADYTVISNNNPLPEALTISPSDISESLEGQLVVIDEVEFLDGGSVFGVGNYSFTSDGAESEIYIRSNHPLIGTDIPLARVELTGIVSQFNSFYQLLPRDIDDIRVIDNFYISTAPEQSDLSKSGFAVRWQTNSPGSSILRYGTDMNLGEEIVINGMRTDHEVSLVNLEPGEFYYVAAASDNGNTEVVAPTQLYATASNSTGEIRIYFNHEVDGTFSSGHYANGYTSAEVEAALISFIDNAQNSIDIAMYNTNRRTIVDALTRAYERGVQVRLVADNETANLALSNPTPPFNILRGNSEGLMHNKFLAIDADSENNAWLISGSMNLTEQNMAMDFNNMLAIQDQSLCKAYRLEFEEMWGSSGDFPGIFNVRFGPSKKDNTPHLFSVGGVLIESYFSPSDNTTAEITEEIDQADASLEFALLTFTNNTLGSAVLNAFQRGAEVRGIIDNISDTGSEYDYLRSNGVNVSEDFTSDQTHHKYCIIDADSPGSDPVVVTGSHNWSASAEDRNDENTLIIHDATISNIFLQEFEARWCEANGGSACTSSTFNDYNRLPGELQLYPNPADDYINISLKENGVSAVIRIYSMAGRLLQAQLVPVAAASHSQVVGIGHLSQGSYICIVEQNGTLSTARFSKL